MGNDLLPRRGMLRLALAGGSVLLGGCGRDSPQLVASRGDLPMAWTRTLPAPWRALMVDTPSEVLAAVRGPGSARNALLQLSDGWATGLGIGTLQPIAAASLLARLAPLAGPVSRLYGSAVSPALAFPWSYSPWVLVLRNRADLIARRGEGWNLLLDPSLTGRLVLPSSPRVVMALIGEDAGRLALLRRQALAYDERDGLNLLMAGEAMAAVLPRQRVVPLLQRDPRLAVVLPDSGSPLSWNLLLRPAGPQPPPPVGWLGQALEAPLLPRLLAGGWVPPLPRATLQKALASFPASLAELLLPADAILARCSDLPPLTAAETRRLQSLWDAAAPAAARA